MKIHTLRNEVAKRYTLGDWLKSRRIATLMDRNSSDLMIASVLQSNRPALVGRIGGTEARYIGEFLKIKKLREKYGVSKKVAELIQFRWEKRCQEVNLNAGFFPRNQLDIEKFVDLNLDALRECDVLGAWGVAFAWPETYAIQTGKQLKVTLIDYTAPWVLPRQPRPEPPSESVLNPPWSSYLHGKKVLVVAGFAETMRKQHNRIKDVFPSVQYPEFELITLRAPLSMGSKVTDGKYWMEHFEYLKSRMEDINFDVAMISAGAYSLPLAHHAKRLHRIGIHSGGALQLFFGIMGNRWNEDDGVTSLLNENWVRPSAMETPRVAQDIEGACYW